MAGVSPANFNGQSLFVPGSYAKRNMTAGDAGNISFSTMVLLGECTGGIPYQATSEYPNAENRINWISSTAECNSILRSGPSYYGALFALTGSNDPRVNAPQKVGIIRVNPATRAMRIVASDTGNCMDIKSLDYGSWTNQIQTKIEAGTTVGKKLTVQFQGNTITGDNISYGLFSIIYTGVGTPAVITIDPAGVLTTTCTGASGDNLSITLSNYVNVGALVGYLQGIPNYSTVLLGDPNFPLAQLDKVTAGDAISILSVYTTRATLQACIDWFNTKATYTTCTYASSGTVRRLPTNDTALISLGAGTPVSQSGTTTSGSAIIASVASTTGIYQGMTVSGTGIASGSVVVSVVANTSVTVSRPCTASATVTVVYSFAGQEGVSVQGDWQSALDNICALNSMQLVGVMTGNAAVQAALSAHCTTMSGIIGRMERQAIVGSAWGDSYNTKVAASQALNNSLVGFVGTGIQRYDVNGVLTNFDGFYTAAILLGMHSGNDVKLPMTSKMVNCLGVELGLSYTDKANYIQNGIIVLAKSDLGGIRVVRTVTTYQGSNLILNEFSALRTALYITADHRNYLEANIGDPGDNTILESLKNRALSRLDFYVEKGYLVVDPQYDNAYRSFTFTPVGDTVQISYEGTLVTPLNFVLTTHNFSFIGFKK
jgi:hypothetical protein